MYENNDYVFYLQFLKPFFYWKFKRMNKNNKLSEQQMYSLKPKHDSVIQKASDFYSIQQRKKKIFVYLKIYAILYTMSL